ncbi:MAG: hypothetical protein ACK4FF_07845 [Limnobacter sp.]|uniref:hypothetical protein n=1 Tax=Limnobacter sp. TaxID=2003368 RepID=UPI00391D50B2
MMTYIQLYVEVSKANMLQSPSFITPAPVFAAVMAMHALDMKLNKQLGITGVGLIHHDHRPWIEYPTKNDGYLDPVLVQRRGAYLFDSIAKPQATPLQPMALTDLKWSILLACKNGVDKEQVKSAVYTMRFAGGQINEERLHVGCFDSLDELSKQLRTGYWLNDASDQLKEPPEKAHSVSTNPAERLLQLTSHTINPFTVPVNLGYSLLASPVARSGSRDIQGIPCDHAYAEHLIGLLQFVPIRQAKENGLINVNHFWRFGWVNDEFLVTNNPSIQLAPQRTEEITAQ